MKKYSTLPKTKFTYLPKEDDIILKNGKRISEMYGQGNYSIVPKLKDIDGVPMELAIIKFPDTGKCLVVLGYTGDLVRNENGEPTVFYKIPQNTTNRIFDKTDVLFVQRVSDRKSNMLLPDGTFLLKKWYDDFVYVNASNLFIVIDENKYNVAKIGGETISETWYMGIEPISPKCFACMDKDTKKYIMKSNGELLFDGKGFDMISIFKVSTSKDYFGGKDFNGKIACCMDTVDGNDVKLVSDDAEIMDFGRQISEINKLRTGVYKIADNNGNCNIIGAKYKLLSEHWFTDIKMEDDASFAYLNDSDFIIFGSKSLVTLNKEMICIDHAIIKSDPVNGLFLCVKRKDGKCNVYCVPNLKDPVSSKWADDVYKTDNGFICMKYGESYSILICSYTGKTFCYEIDGKNIYDLYYKNSYCIQKSNGKFYFAKWNSAEGLKQDNKEFDDVYDISSPLPIIKIGDKYNVISVVTWDFMYKKWYDDIQPSEDNEHFDCLLNGEWIRQ